MNLSPRKRTLMGPILHSSCMGNHSYLSSRRQRPSHAQRMPSTMACSVTLRARKDLQLCPEGVYLSCLECHYHIQGLFPLQLKTEWKQGKVIRFGKVLGRNTLGRKKPCKCSMSSGLKTTTGHDGAEQRNKNICAF